MRVSIISLLVLLSQNYNYAQWIQTDGPSGFHITQMVQTGSRIYANTYSGGMYFTTNGGLNWSRMGSELSGSLNIICLAAKGDSVFAGTQDRNNGMQGGIYFSSNSGSNWTFVLPMIPGRITRGMLINGTHIIAPSSIGTSYVIYLSANFGASWDSVVTPYAINGAMAINGNMIFAGGEGVQMSVSTDNGFSWSILPNSPVFVETLIINNNEIYAGTGNLVYKSTDNGNNWLATQNGIPGNRRVTSFGVIGNNLYVGTYVVAYRLGGVFKTSDDGNSWSPAGLGIYDVEGFGTSGNTLLAGSIVGVFKTSNEGANWAACNSGFQYMNVSVLCSSGNRLFAGAGRLCYTTNSGDHWDFTDYDGSDVRSLYSDGSRIAVGGYNTLYISTDNGGSFSFISGGFVGAPTTLAAAILGNSIVGGNYWNYNHSYGLCLTVNSGGNWTLWSCPLYLNVRGFAVDNQNIYAATSQGVYITTNSGFNWTPIYNGLPASLDILSVAASGSTIVAGTNDAGPYISTNGGALWMPINSGITASSVFSVIIKGNTIFAGLNSPARNKIFYSTDWGASWLHLDDNLAGYTITALAADSSYLYASTGTQAGVWRRPFAQITGIQPSSNNVPNRFSLYQNYPNPFNPGTKISYDIPSAVNVKLVIYDILGQEVKTLVNEKQNSGRHEIEFDASNYPSGVYYYKLIVIDASTPLSITKKMVLLK